MLHLDGDTILDQVEGRRENFVPLHTTDVVEFLALHPKLRPAQQSDFRELSSLILALLHHLYRRRHEQLTYVYAPLDPDRDRMLRSVPTASNQDLLVEELFDRTHEALQRANYHQLGPEDIQKAVNAASQWGVRMRVNFKMLERMEVYARGLVVGKRAFKNWRRWFRTETVDVQLYQRIVVLFRVKPELASTQFDARRVYLRMFKNVPHEDIDMMLPATGFQMTWLDHSRIVVPSLYAAAITLWRFLRNVFLLALFGVFKTVGLVILVIFAIGFGLKSMFSYRTHTKRRYMLNMAQSLYYQNLDNNAGVLLRLLDDGEQQEAGEAILAYFAAAILLDRTAPMALQDIDLVCEDLILEATGLHVDFDVKDSARTLAQLGVFSEGDQGWTALPLELAKQQLDETWDNWFGD